MTTQTRTGPVSFAEFLELIREDQKADLIDGVIYMASPESVGHNDCIGFLFNVLSQFVRRRGFGRVNVNRVAYRLSSGTAPEPDLAFVAASRASIVKHGYVDGPPDVAVEFVSPDSVLRDYELKRRAYEKAGVAEYWIIDLDERRATFYVLESGVYRDAPLTRGEFHSRAIPGFRLNPTWFWQNPLPDSLEIVLALLESRA